MFYRNAGTWALCLAISLSLVITYSLQQAPRPVQAQSPAAPILVVVNDNAPNPLGRYLGEILSAEGVNAYEFIELAQLTAGDLANYTVTVLAETPLTGAQATLFANHVAGGGRLIAMRPDPQIRNLFGLGAFVNSATGAYLGIENATTWNGKKPGLGLTGATLQIHGPVDNYQMGAGGILLARLYQDATSSTNYPAVAANQAGNAVAFTYDLAWNIAHTRQGNPQNADVDVDGDAVFRTIDLFQQQGGGAPWIDLNKIPIPQADVQQRYFVRLVRQLFEESAPLPQFWYFPDGAKAALVLTADAHANSTHVYQYQIDSLTPLGAKLNFYLSIGGEPDDATLQAWRAQGHKFGIHPYAYRPDSYEPYNIQNLAQGYSAFTSWYDNSYSTPPSRTVRNHQVAWLGWTGAAAIAASHGYAMDLTYYHWGPWLKKANGEWPHGYITGSGQPMRFVTSSGAVLPVYQQLTQLVDEHLFNPALQNLSAAEGAAISRQLIDRSLAGDYAAITAQIHVDHFAHGTVGPWAIDTINYAVQNDVPLLNADEWLAYVEARAATRFANMNWNAETKTLDFSVVVSGGTGGNEELGVLLPNAYAGEVAHSVWIDGAPTGFQTITVSDREYALITTAAGTHDIRIAYSGVLPTNTPTPTSTPTNTSTATPTRTSTPTPTPTKVDPGQSITHTSYAHFTEPCASHQNTWPRLMGSNGVRLAGVQHSWFTGNALQDQLWSFGSWNDGNFEPVLSNGVLRLPAGNGGWVRSNQVHSYGVLEAIAAFGNGAWQHVGFGSNAFEANRFILFSTYTGDGRLYARVNNNVAEQRVDLGPIPGGFQHYRIDWEPMNDANDRARFFVNGEMVATLDVPRNGASGFHTYFSNNHLQAANNAALEIAAVSVSPPYAESGTYTSCVQDAGSGYRWTRMGWTAEQPSNTSLQAQMRHSTDGVEWNPWETVDKGSGSAQDGFTFEVGERYMQYRFIFTSASGSASAILTSATLNAEIDTGIRPTPTPTLTPTSTPIPTSTPTPTPTAIATEIPSATDTPSATSTPNGTQIPPGSATSTPVPGQTPTPTETLNPVAPATLTPSPTVIPGQGGNPEHPYRLLLPVLERR